MRDVLLLSGAVLVTAIGGFAGCAGGSNVNGVGASTSVGGSTTSTTSMGGSTTSTTSMGGSTTTSTTTTSTTTTTNTGGMGGTGGTTTTTTTTDPGLSLGANCNQDSDCASMLCKDVVVGTGQKVCVTPCTQQSDCGTSPAFFCEPTLAGSTDGYCIPHSPAHCLSCMSSADCGSLSEVCFQAPGDNAPACHIDCSIAGQDACPPDYSCTDQTVSGIARKLCRPKIIPTCLDAIGGFCDRLTIPQACLRSNTAGKCIGERDCLPASKRFDKCNAASPQCKTDCSVQDPAGCMDNFCAGATSAVTNCGTCGNVCPGYQKPNDNVTCDATQKCTFSCQGENYDVNNDTSDGCEVADSPMNNHSQATATDLGSMPCNDGSSNPNISNVRIVSDKRVHEMPAVNGFNTGSGSAPDWYHIHATGGLGCQDDIGVTLQINGSSSPACYKLTIKTNVNTYIAQTNGGGTASISSGSGSYGDGTDIYIIVEKTCGTNVTENVTYSVMGHF